MDSLNLTQNLPSRVGYSLKVLNPILNQPLDIHPLISPIPLMTQYRVCQILIYE